MPHLCSKSHAVLPTRFRLLAAYAQPGAVLLLLRQVIARVREARRQHLGEERHPSLAGRGRTWGSVLGDPDLVFDYDDDSEALAEVDDEAFEEGSDAYLHDFDAESGGRLSGTPWGDSLMSAGASPQTIPEESGSQLRRAGGLGDSEARPSLAAPQTGSGLSQVRPK